ncbi:hypothetical protein MNV49_006106 [Pseudohyphozyma bogoriensis]|nr:hypothetical protein MNV49_006106 [Pseudohyphozyma bogoriensis]
MDHDTPMATSEVNLEEHRAKLTRLGNELLDAVRLSWRDGEERSSELLKVLTDEILAWLSVVYDVAVKGRREFEAAAKAMEACHEGVKVLQECQSRLPTASATTASLLYTITSPTSSTPVYSPSPLLPLLSKLWRDLLLASLAEDEEDVVQDIIDFLEKTELMDAVMEFVRSEDAGNTTSGNSLDDTSVTPDMKARIPTLHRALLHTRLTSFYSRPTLILYSQLSPAHSATLLPFIRSRVLDPSAANQPREEEWRIAVKLFEEEEEVQSLLRVLEALSGSPGGKWRREVMQDVVKWFASKVPPNSASRPQPTGAGGEDEDESIEEFDSDSDSEDPTSPLSLALPSVATHLKQLLSSSSSLIWRSLHRAFPSLEDAWEYLVTAYELRKEIEVVEEGKQTEFFRIEGVAEALAGWLDNSSKLEEKRLAEGVRALYAAWCKDEDAVMRTERKGKE